MLFSIGNLFITVVEPCYEEITFLCQVLKFECANGVETQFYNLSNHTFPSGLLSLACRQAKENGFDIQIQDDRDNKNIPLLSKEDRDDQLYWLRDYQRDAVEAGLKATRGILWLPTGCHGKGTKVIMANGAIQSVETIKVGDQVMGCDLRPRTVQKLCRGTAPMYNVVPSKGSFRVFTANEDHILTLTPFGVLSYKEAIQYSIDVSVREYLEDPLKYEAYGLFKAPYIRYPVKKTNLRVLMTPGYLMWLSRNKNSALPVDALKASLKERFHLLISILAPNEKKLVSERIYSFDTASRTLATQLEKLAISIGLPTYTSTEGPKKEPHYSVSIIASKKSQYEVQMSSFRIDIKSTSEEYYGFVLDQDHRYLLDDRTITHNSGKTDILTGLMRSVPTNWVMMVHNKKLMYDAAKRYELREHQNWLRMHVKGEDGLPKGPPDYDVEYVMKKLDSMGLRWGEVIEPAGLVGDGKRTIQRNTFCVARSLATGLEASKKSPKYKEISKLLNEARGVIVDECHIAATNTFYDLMMQFPNAYYRIGMSATPLDRGDKKTHFAVACLGVPKYRIHNKTLQEKKVLAVPEIHMHPCFQEYTPPKCYKCQGLYAFNCQACGGRGYTSKSWHLVRDRLITKSEKRNQLIADIVESCTRKPILVFVDMISHGEDIKKRLAKKGLTAEFVHGNHKVVDRTKFAEDLSEGTADILIASKVFQEGVDIPQLESVVIACGGKSVIAILQKIGRGMRVTAEKSTFEVHDVFDQGNPWLEKHSKARLKSFEKEGHTVKIKGKQ